MFQNRRRVSRSRSYVTTLASLEVLEDRLLLTNFAVGDEMRNYRIAVAATAEFTANVGSQAAALTTIQSLVSGLNDFYEKEAAVHFDLVSGTNLVFTNSATDGYSNNSANGATNLGTLINQNQSKIDTVIGTANYDVGIVVGYEQSGGGAGSVSARGVAELESVSQAGDKAKAATIGSDPNWSGFLGVLIHELGHQFDMGHTFNGANGNCAGSQWSSSSAVEPGSGSTLMAYNGICGSDDLPADGEELLHSFSFEEMNDFINRPVDPATPFSTTTIANAIPTVDAGVDYVIPANTPFELTGVGSDADAGDSLSYSWEQIDVATAQQALPVSDTGSNPLFRVFSPKSEPTRVFPRLSDLVANTSTAGIGEALPTTTRDLNFRVTVRDGNSGISSDDVLVQSHNTGSAFTVSVPNTGVTWTGGSTQTVSWNVAGTTAAPISTANVNILMSTDGGLSYPMMLASSVPNDGSQSVLVPNLNAANARIKVQGAGNIFFDISNVDFTVNANPAAPGITFVESGDSTRVSEGTFRDSYTVALNTAPAGSVTVALTADADTLISLDGTTFGTSQSLVLTSTAATTIHVKAVDDALEEGSQNSLITHVITASSSASYPIGFSLPVLAVDVVDDELPPVIGIDFGFGDMAQPEWANQDFLSGSHSNLPEDDGTASPVDLSVTYSGGGNSSPVGPNASQIPRHNESLAGIDGYAASTGTFTATWNDLDPTIEYAVYVMGYHQSPRSQSVVIAGATSLPSFTQDLNTPDLQINDEAGTSSRTLQSYEHIVAATAGGSITVTVSPNAGSAGTGISGLAIRPIYPADSVPLGSLGSGIAATDDAFGTGYIMYTEQSVHTRFANIIVTNSDQLIAVQYTGGQWYYNSNAAWVAFTPVASDRLLAAVDFDNDTMLGLQNIGGTVNGIDQGYVGGDLSFVVESWNGSSNAGEMQVLGTNFEIPTTALPDPGGQYIGQLRSGVAVHDTATGIGHVMFSAGSVHTRFAASAVNATNSDHLIAVQFTGGQWFYNNDAGWVAFTPVVGDRLVADADFTADTISSLQNLDGQVNGIDNGFLNGDLTFVADQYGGVVDNGEFQVTGTHFEVPPRVLIGATRAGIAVTDNAKGTGFIMYSETNVKNRFAGLFSANSDHLIVVQNQGPGLWFYNNNAAWVAFTPVASDRLLANADFINDTVTPLQGDFGQFEGINRGYAVGDLAFFADQWVGVNNDGEFQVTGTYFEPALTAGSTGYTLGDIGAGLAVNDFYTGTGYVLYSRTPVQNRVPAISSATSTHMAAVRYFGGQWQMNDNIHWVNFTPDATDRLIATVDFGGDTIAGITTTGVINGIDSGYISGDLTFTANWWNGAFNTGEFTVGGTFFEATSTSNGPTPSAFAPTEDSPFTLDADGNGHVQPVVDGVGFLRYLAGFSDASFKYGSTERDLFMDIDGDGFASALTDGMLILRYLSGFRGQPLIENVVSPAGTRTTADQIESWLAQFSVGTNSVNRQTLDSGEVFALPTDSAVLTFVLDDEDEPVHAPVAPPRTPVALVDELPVFIPQEDDARDDVFAALDLLAF